jgi:hypothetical protein
VSRVGRIIRCCSIDELPQFVNVLTRQMSVVGPRPPLRREVDSYYDHVRRRLLVRPGSPASCRSVVDWICRGRIRYASTCPTSRIGRCSTIWSDRRQDNPSGGQRRWRLLRVGATRAVATHQFSHHRSVSRARVIPVFRDRAGTDRYPNEGGRHPDPVSWTAHSAPADVDDDRYASRGGATR